jgi:cytochrome c oxidase subunit 2
MISQDVIHAFYVPAFRTQMHVVPGRYVNMWFTATKPGRYHLFCGMYCGGQHSEMGGEVVVMEPRDFAQWVANGGNSVPTMTMEQAGAKLYGGKLACNICHGGQSNPRAPSLYGIFGKPRQLADGTSRVANEEYLRESILRPHNRLTAGYGPTMPAYEGQVDEREILNIIAFIKSMGTPQSVPASSIVGPGSFGADQARTNGRDPLAVGTIGARQPRTDATATVRQGSPSVGAIAARENAGGEGKR